MKILLLLTLFSQSYAHMSTTVYSRVEDQEDNHHLEKKQHQEPLEKKASTLGTKLLMFQERTKTVSRIIQYSILAYLCGYRLLAKISNL